MSATDDLVLFESRDDVALVTLNRPESRNAVNEALAAALEAAIDRIEDDPLIRVGILRAETTGQNTPVFCAGADLKALNSGRGNLGTQRGGFAGFVYRDRAKPIIAAVDGLATAGGCEIVLACDLVVASTRSSFGLAEVKRNLIAGAGGLFRLPRAIGRSAAMELILTGEPLDAHRAHDLGMINRVVEPEKVMDTALALASLICRSAPMAVAESRRIVLASAYETDETLVQMSNSALARLMKSEDLKEGLAAFIEKRPPRWTGR